MDGRADIVDYQTAEGCEKDGAKSTEMRAWIFWAVCPAPGGSLQVAWACIAFTWVIT